MMGTLRLRATLLWGCAVLALAGCQQGTGGRSFRPKKMVIPAGIAGTVTEYADLVGADEMLVRGYGVVVGLGQAGSDEVRADVRNYLVQEMLKAGLGSYVRGTQRLTPRQMLRDKDTAVVVVAARIPPGAPVGTRFDVFVQALPKSQTLSLDGGVLMSTKLRLGLSTAVGTAGEIKDWALGRGPIFVNPFIDRADPTQQAKLRAGRVPGGGVVSRGRSLRLQLRSPDLRVVSLIARRLNERFGGLGDVATSKSASMIELRVPSTWRYDHEHFLQLVRHVYLWGGPAEDEKYAKQLKDAILQPAALYEDIALVWEAMGRRVLGIIQPLYTSTNPAAAFHATRTGLRLEDALAIDPMIRFARQANSPYQISAIRALGRARWSVQPVHTLRGMLSEPNELVRVAAYEALMDHGPTGAVQRVKISQDFVMDIVDTDRDYAIYATQTGPAKIVLFGRSVPIRRPVFYCPPDDLVTINAPETAKEVTVYRRIPRTGQMSDAFRVDPHAHSLIKTLGRAPELAVNGEVDGLGFTYSQVVSILYGLCKAKHIPADFVLQRSPAMQRIYMAISPVSRSDMPEDE